MLLLCFRYMHKTLVRYLGMAFNPCPAEPGMSCLCKQCNLDQLSSEEANWSGFALFAIQYLNLYQQPGSSNLIGWKLENVCGILIYSAGQGLTLVWPILSYSITLQRRKVLIHTHIHTRIHIHTHTYTNACTHIYTYTHTHTQANTHQNRSIYLYIWDEMKPKLIWTKTYISFAIKIVIIHAAFIFRSANSYRPSLCLGRRN